MLGLLDYLKLGAGIAVGVLITSLYWTGVPILNDYPILKNIPLLGHIAVGHVQTVKDEALKGYVLESEKTTAEAKAAELERQRNASAQALEEARKRQAADDAAQLAKDAQTEIEIADYEKKLSAANRQCLADPADVQFLQSH
ncbi:hypothetical protein [Rhizobium sp. AB2/73]|uniref:hypothetical protein n=1 Tax=Rhizobium sp. AB2/73 TaxID=2795216 RepID=UPI000DDD7179|nr:hypothetical protein [Rhizobium sp. AB2/73]QYA12115.1 hypothetical protein J5284_16575 [Rhizobium sp. AB2/73]UEQ81954.1 hypothetical protein I8E17_05430 [Rhizobium sp. AB2/73]